MKDQQSSLKQILQPYLFISIAGLLAFAPVSFMLRALKNDVIALEYPINHFISQCIRNGELPYWFNTWGMGFPLQSNLTWGIFSTPQLVFSSLFDYNIYILHVEFMFFVLLAGWGMFYLLHKYIVKDKGIAQLLAISYMLSGFMVGSTQWLLYITAACFIPLVLSCLLKLLYKPTVSSAFQFAVTYSLMFTSVYAAFNIITTYGLLAFLLIWFWQSKDKIKVKLIVLRYLSFAGLLTFLLCLPCLYYTLELLKSIERGSSIVTAFSFFNSNYLHPSALSTLLFPFSSVKMSYSNTEGTMLNSYAGLLILILLPALIWQSIKEKKRIVLIFLLAAIVFLLISFGDITPARNTLNLLPGFSYFRNPAIFRFYFIMLLIFFVAEAVKNKSFSELFNFKINTQTKIIYNTIWIIAAICLFVLILHRASITILSPQLIKSAIKNINYNQTLFISSFIQLLILLSLLLSIKKKWFTISKILFTTDLIINTLICTPFFSVSSYTIPEVSRILHSVPGFPVQNIKPAEAAATYTDDRNNRWNNINVFRKEISSNDTYRGPLTLMQNYQYSTDSLHLMKTVDNKLVFLESESDTGTIQLLIQKPTHIQVAVNPKEQTSITLQQNYYPGWKGWYNNNSVDIIKNNSWGITIRIPKGKGIIDFRYERTSVWLTALLLHLITISFLLWKGLNWLRKFFFKSSSPS